MKKAIALSLAAAAASLLSLAACDTTVKKSELESVDYGPRPEHWQEEIRNYLSIRLTDPKAAIVEFRAGPEKLYQRETPVRKKEWGWAVCVWVNDKNKQGAYDGFYPMSVFIRNEKIEQVNGGPDDDNLVGNRYAREHCEQLGAPFKK
jgi:hypothetical protein